MFSVGKFSSKFPVTGTKIYIGLSKPKSAICYVSPTWMSILRRKGMTKAGFMLLRRPIVQMASSLISNTSSFNATNSACKFSAWARWASKRSSKDASTQYRMSGSAGEQGHGKSQTFRLSSSGISCSWVCVLMPQWNNPLIKY